MATMQEADRSLAYQDYMAQVCSARESIGTLTKAEIRAALNALDQWFSDNAATINAAIPQPARGQLTTDQKARLAMLVIRNRYLKGA